MKRVFFILLLVVSSSFAYGDDIVVGTKADLEYTRAEWALFQWNKGNDAPIVLRYRTDPKNDPGDNVKGKCFYHLYLREGVFTTETSKLDHGFCFDKGQLYIYNYNTRKTTLALDFTLSAGDHFTTMNEVEWVVEEVKDTTVTFFDTMINRITYSDTHRLLNVKSVDGKYTDQWLENFGSLSYLFVMEPLEGIKASQLACMRAGYVFARTFNADPLFGYDTLWPIPGEDTYDYSIPATECTYNSNNNMVSLSYYSIVSPARHFYVAYRNETDIHIIWYSEIPCPFASAYQKRHFNMEFWGVPKSTTGYTVYWDSNRQSATTDITSIKASAPHSLIFDLQGRPVSHPKRREVFVEKRRKVVVQ